MKIRFLFFLLIYCSGQLFAQILDDTTKEIYSNRSTKFFLQEDVFKGAPLNRTVDTSINYLHYYNYQISGDNWYQNLGNMGTAMKPIFFRQPGELGYRFGFDSYLPYLQTPAEQRYFDTKSPYSELKFLQGSTGEQRLFLLFTRNVNRYLNLGASYNRFTSVKQFSPASIRDFQTDHHQINIFSSIKTKKDKYQALVNFNYMQHWNYESGGIDTLKTTENINSDGLYLYKYANVRLFRDNAAAARNYYRNTNLHIYQQFNPLDSGNTLFQVFHEGDWKRETQYFRDNNMRVDSAFKKYYGGVNFKDSNMTFYREKLELFQNKVGIKGYTNSLFYSLYYKARTYSLIDTSQDINTMAKSKTWFHDSFAGGGFGYKINDRFSFSVDGEAMLGFSNSKDSGSNYKKHDDYKWGLKARYSNWNLLLSQTRNSPTLLQTRLVNNIANWSYHEDSLTAVLYRNANFYYLKTNGPRFLKVGINYQRVDNLIYFRNTAKKDSVKIKPVQEKGYIDYVQPYVSFRTNYKWLFLENELIITHLFKDSTIHMPSWFVMPKIYYQNFLFNRAVELQVGAEVILKDNYYADAYAPQYNTFYWQENFEVKTFPITNAFLNFQISRAKIFLRVSNIFGGQYEQHGYQETPYYSGMKRSFQFGVFWRAFN
ncbi:MAG: hypothetical protein H7329_01300 [Opitutaceae bacterium]|nr:hypothetical protein [Cytophagales bacterium]